MTEFIIRKGKTETTFTGEQLVSHSSQKSPSQTNWSVYEIYKTISGKYVVVIYGNTKIESQKQRVNIIESLTPKAVKEALKTPRGGNVYLTNTAREALRLAGHKDQGLHDIYYKDDIT